MNPKKMWQMKACLIVLLLICGGLTVASFFSGNEWIWVFAGAFAVMLIVTVIRFRFIRRDSFRLLGEIAKRLDTPDREALNRFPLPVLVVGERREILWYSESFRANVLGDYDIYGSSLDEISRTPVESFYLPNGVDLSYGGKHYTAFGFHSEAHKLPVDILYFVDNTCLKILRRNTGFPGPAS